MPKYTNKELSSFLVALKKKVDEDVSAGRETSIAGAAKSMGLSPGALTAAFHRGTIGFYLYKVVSKHYRDLPKLDTARLKKGRKVTIVKTQMADKPVPTKPACQDISVFELGCYMGQLGRRPDAPRWIEVLEQACKQGLPFSQVVSALKGAQVEASRGNA